MALCRLQSYFIIWPYPIHNDIILFGIYYKSWQFRYRKSVINKLRVPPLFIIRNKLPNLMRSTYLLYITQLFRNIQKKGPPRVKMKDPSMTPICGWVAYSAGSPISARTSCPFAVIQRPAVVISIRFIFWRYISKSRWRQALVSPVLEAR